MTIGEKPRGQDMREIMDRGRANVPIAGPGTVNQGASANDDVPPVRVREGARPDLYERALKRMSRHFVPGDVDAACEEDPELREVFE